MDIYDEINKNVKELKNKIKKIKKTKDYGILYLKGNESIIYPEIMEMKQNVWVSNKDKIEINYLEDENNFKISIIFMEEQIEQAFDIILFYLNEWAISSPEYDDKWEVKINDEKFEVMLYEDIIKITGDRELKPKEIIKEKEFLRVDEAVWVSYENIEKIIKEKNTKKIDFEIKKVKNYDNPWKFISCWSFTFESKYYEPGYLSNLESKRKDECFKKFKKNIV